MEDENSVNYFAIIPASVRYDEDLPANAKLLYGEITALSNKKGYCYASNSYFANLYKVSTRSIQLWVSALAAKGYIKVEISYIKETKKVEERRITIEGPHENNFVDPMKKISPPPRKNFHHPHEKNFVENNTSINNTSNNTSNNNNTSVLTDFEYLWNLYPKKEGRKAALAAYERAVKKGTTKEEVEKGIRAYLEQIRINNTERQYIKNGDTFFKGEHWTNDYNCVVNNTNGIFNKYGGISAGAYRGPQDDSTFI